MVENAFITTCANANEATRERIVLNLFVGNDAKMVENVCLEINVHVQTDLEDDAVKKLNVNQNVRMVHVSCLMFVNARKATMVQNVKILNASGPVRMVVCVLDITNASAQRDTVESGVISADVQNLVKMAANVGRTSAGVLKDLAGKRAR